MAAVVTAIVLGVTTALDNLAVGASYGFAGRRVLKRANLLIAITNAATTLITMLLGVSISNHLSADAAQGLGAAIFIFLGLSDLRKACLASSLFSWPPKPITTFTLSSYLIIYVLFGARSGVDGTEDRMLLQTNADGTSSLVRIPEYSVTAATLMESIMDNVIAIEVEARLALSPEEACLPLASLRRICSTRLRAAVEPFASKVERVACVSVQMREQDPAASTSVAVIDAVVALAESSDAFLCIDAVVASGSVLGMELSAGKTFPSAQRRTPNPESSAASGQTGQADAEEDANKRSGAVGLVEVAPVALGLCLTNVAGGIGAGAANLPLGISTGAAFVCSLALFYFGHLLAGELKSFLVSDKVEVLSGILMLLLGLSQIP